MRSVIKIIFLSVLVVSFHANAESTIPSTAEADRSQLKFVDNIQKTEPKFVEKKSNSMLPVTNMNKLDKNSKIYLRKIMVTGSKSFKEEDFFEIYEDYIGKDVKISTLEGIASAISAEYKNQGYLLSSVIIPEQSFSNGVVYINIIEAQVDEITVVGYYKPDTVVEGIIKKIVAMSPLNLNVLEKYMLFLNDVPGVKAKVVLKPKDYNPKGARVIEIVIVIEDKEHSHSLTYDNLGSGYSGMHQLGIQTGVNSMPVKYHKAGIDAFVALPFEELVYVQLSYAFPISSEGAMFGTYFSHSRSQPGYRIEHLDIHSETYDLKFAFTQPIIRSRESNWSVLAELAFKRSETDAAASRLYEDKLTVLTLSTSFNNVDDFNGANIGTVSVARGLNMLGARETGSALLSRARGKSDFTKINATLGRLQRVMDNVNLYVSATGQYAFSSLLSSQEFGYGGRSFGRAYDSSELTGDHGLAAIAELRYQGLPRYADIQSELYAFYDIGKVWDRVRKSVRGRDEGSSAGFGMRFYYDDVLTGNIYTAAPLNRAIGAPTYGNPKSWRYFASLSVDF